MESTFTFRHLLAAVTILWTCLTPGIAAEQRVTFHNSIAALPPAVAPTQRAVLAVNQADTMEFGVALKLRNYDQMQARIERGETISRDELERVHLPLASDYDAVVQWLTAEGFVITRHDPSRLVVYAQGTVTQVQQSLQVHMVTVTANGGINYNAADTAPSLPLSIATPVLGINHLQPFHQHHKHAVRQPLTANSPPFKVSEILTAYSGTGMGVTGANQKIAILIDTPAKNSDLTSFWSANGIAQSTSNVEVINVNNATLAAPIGEESLDEEWTSGIAPGAKIRVYASGTLNDADLDRCLQQLINDLPTQPQLHQLSISLGLGETYISQAQFTTNQQLFATIASGGVSIFVSSGDGGSTPDNFGGSTGPLQVEHYASDPSVTAVGGTSLYVNSTTGARSSESAWSGSGGGVSIQFSRPSWQTGTGVPAGTKRCVPDVALVADANTGAYVVLNGTVYEYGGTSWSAPAWAGFCALVNEARANAGKAPLGLINPSLYPLIGTNNFMDVTTGSNATSKSGGKYAATAGYDQATGIGVPHMSNLLATLAAQLPAAPTITGFTPSSGVQHTTVAITGTNFGSVSTVEFHGTNAAFTVNSTTQITALSPAGATSGPITVTTPGGTATSANNFTVVSGPPAPTIIGFSPAYGPIATAVVLTGTDFTAATTVTFNGTAAAFTVNSATQISTVVPGGASSGPVSVTTPSGTATSIGSFTVLTGDGTPTITSFAPTGGVIGATVTISGTNFLDVNSVTFGGVAALSPTITSPTQITATIPTGAATGPIVVTTGLGAATSAANFTVSAAPIVLASWDMSGQTGFGTSPLAATAAANITVGGLTRGSGITITGTAAARGWGGNGFDSSSAAAAVTAGDFAAFTVAPNAGYTLSFTSLSKFDYRRSSTGALSGVLQYQVGGGAFVDAAAVSYSSSSSSGSSLAAIDLSGIGALQNVAPGTTVTFRIVNYGATSSGGTWYLYDVANSTAADFAMNGSVNPVVVTTPDLAIAKSHTGNFMQGDTGKPYMINVTNIGTGPTSGTVTVVDTLPTGLTATAMSGTGWTVTLGTLTATRSDVLAAGSAYPPSTITVDVATNTAASVTNSARVSGGGETNAANNSASDPTTIVALPPKVGVETAADGSGAIVPAQTIGVGSSVTVYSVARTFADTFTSNAAATWSLTSVTGGIVAGDLVPAPDNSSAVFTPFAPGTAVIHAVITGSTPVDSGVLTAGGAPVNSFAASNVSDAGSTLNGGLNPNGTPTTIYFEYGTTTAYGQTTPQLSLGSGTGTVTFELVLATLQQGTTYHFRLVSIAGGVTTRYVDQTFTTSASGGSDVPSMPPWSLAALVTALLGAAALSLGQTRRPSFPS